MVVKHKKRRRGGASHPCGCAEGLPTRVIDTRRPSGKSYVVRIRMCPCKRKIETREKVVR